MVARVDDARMLPTMTRDDPFAPSGTGEVRDFSGRPLRYVQPGQVAIATEPQSFVTIVGSCVSVCVFDSEGGVGGLNHFLLPRHLGDPDSARYGPGAMRRLLDGVAAVGAARARLAAKVFGGACVLAQGLGGARHLGRENVAVAMETLAEAGIPVVGEDLGGTRGRKLVFHADTGVTWVRKL
jgi:chemotaxis protein CheD